MPGARTISFFRTPFMLGQGKVCCFVCSSNSYRSRACEIRCTASSRPLKPCRCGNYVLRAGRSKAIRNPKRRDVLGRKSSCCVICRQRSGPRSGHNFRHRLYVSGVRFTTSKDVEGIVPARGKMNTLTPSIIGSRGLTLNTKMETSSYCSSGFHTRCTMSSGGKAL